jgi:hypothetical protein
MIESTAAAERRAARNEPKIDEPDDLPLDARQR